MANASPFLLAPRSLPSRHGFRALVGFAGRSLRQRLGARIALLYGVGIALSYAIFILLAASSNAELGARTLVLRALRAASIIVAGLVALSLAADWERIDAEQGTVGLLRLRGLSPESLAVARWVAGARRIALLVGVPGVLLCALAGLRVRTLVSGLELVAMAAAAALYAVVLGASVSALALAARALAPRYGRLLLGALVILPHAARELWPALPSVPSLLGWLLALVGRVGGVAS